VFRHFGWDVEEARKQVLEGFVMSTFRNLLFQRVIPNLKRIGLLTDRIRPKFEELGILDFENLATDGDIDWSALERPLDTDEAQSHEQSMLAQFHERHEAEVEALKGEAETPQQQVAQDDGQPQAGGCC
jgi:hypothetical protein